MTRFDLDPKRPLAMVETDGGDWVRYSDAQAEIARLTAERDATAAEAYNHRKALEVLRPVWAHGWTDDSQAAQASAGALGQIWDYLGARNQTEAMQAVEAAQAEIARLEELFDLSKKTSESVLERAEKAEAERDEAQAQVRHMEGFDCCTCRPCTIHPDAQLDQMLAEAERKGMQRAAGICDAYCTDHLEPAPGWDAEYVSAWETGGLDHLMAARDAIISAMSKERGE